MAKNYVLALDQGTTSSRAILFDRAGRVVDFAQKEITQIYPEAGWVEHDPMEMSTTKCSGISILHNVIHNLLGST